MPVPDSLPGVALLALCASLPVVVVGALVIRLARSWSVTVSMVALVLIPTLATYAGVFWASRSMIHPTFGAIAVVLAVVAVVTLP
ncbi:MAG: sensor histidine kinase, partial [Mycobacterium sp.]|nr:sensor histidine kinase [Mycobacterium sp.]